ncbi:macro domain-containing protein [Vibrio sagamiensis]|uniref:macro domain-containing protein n=1 Tax=Vibrio sagamiensis TaxID=512650 RepID=UPI0035307E28
MEYIKDGLVDLKKEVKRLELTSAALPALGSGLGGLPWTEVEREIQASLSEMPEVEWRIYPPQKN